jgi:DNA-binding SARP family transcriptional activator/class 3 adenylate cyclase/tetratricopeptide (TPR) repeat protein
VNVISAAWSLAYASLVSRAVEGRATNTLLFTDLVGSTELRCRVGEDEADRFIVAEQLRVDEVVEGHGGWVVKGTGDGVLAAFAGAADALDAAVAIQQASRHPVRIGISIGEVSWHGGDCFGRPVVEAARLVARAEPSEVLVTDLVAVLAGGRGGHRFESLGTVELKGLVEPLAVSRLRWEVVASGGHLGAGATAVVELLEVRMLGPLEVLDGGHRLLGLSRRPSEVLVCLALSVGDLVTMDRLIDMLWADEPPPKARNAVQAHVAALRRHLGTGGRQMVESQLGGYRLSSATVTDVARFDDLCRQAAAVADPRERGDLLGGALALWRGRPVEDLTAAGFNHPALTMLEERRLAILEARLDADLAVGRARDVASELELLVADHPYHEGFVARLALALYRMGRQTEALRSIRRLVDRLRDGVGVDVGPEVRRLEQQILTQDEALLDRPIGGGPAVPVRGGHRTPLPPPLRPVPTVAFAGRTAEWEMLDQAWDAACKNTRAVVLIGGEAGAGKTRLAAEYARAVHGQGGMVLFGGADEDLDVPYQPVVEALENLIAGVGENQVRSWAGAGVGYLARLVPRLGQGSSPMSADNQPHRAFSAIADLLRAMCGEAPVLWVIDDLQWAGPTSMQLIRHVLRAAADLRLLVLATHRDDGDRAGPLIGLTADLARLDGVRRLRLAGLDVSAVASVVGDESLAQVLVERTGGNPFFLTELYRHLREGGSLDHTPVSVADVIARRVSRLPDDVESVLAVASVVGITFDLEVVRQAWAGEGVEEALEHALRARLVEDEPGPRLTYRFPHALARSALYDRLSTRRRAELHRNVAVALEQVHSDVEPVVAELARHWSLAAPLGNTAPAVEWCRRAAAQAAEALGFQEAAAHLRRGLDVAGPAAPARLRAELLVELARMLDEAGESMSSLDAASAAAELAITHGWDELVVQAAVAFPGGLTIWASNRGQRGTRLVEAGLERCEPGTPEHACLLSKLAALSLFTAPVEQRLELVGRALDELSAESDPTRRWQALRELEWSCDPCYGHPVADRVMIELDRLAGQGGAERRFAIVNARLHRAIDAGRGDLFRAALLDQPDEKNLSETSLALVFAHRGHLALWDGELDEAARLYQQCWEIALREFHDTGWGILVFSRVLISWLRGDLSVVRSDVAAFCAELGGRNLEAVRAWVDLGCGEPQTAERFLSEFGERDHRVMLQSQICGQGLAAASLAAAHLRDRASILKILAVWQDVTAEVYTPPPAPALAKAYYQGILAFAADDAKTAEERLRSSLTVHERLCSVPYVAASRAALAEVLLQRGERDEAGRLARQAAETSSRIGAWGIAQAADTMLAHT